MNKHNTSNQTLEGLQECSWGAQVLQKYALTANNAPIESAILYPLVGDHPPIEAYILSLDFGKRALKVGGVDKFADFHARTFVDAYAAAKQLKQQEESGEGESIWKVRGPGEAKLSEAFRFGNSALRTAEALPVNETAAARLEDPRVRNMTICAVIQILQDMKIYPTVYEDGMPVLKKLHVVLCIGLPVDDLTRRREETEQALQHLKGEYRIEQFDTKSGKTETWAIEVNGFIPTPQPRGTHYTAMRRLDGTPALPKKITTVIDIGGGDIYAYEVDSSSGVVVEGQRLGDGTIAIARELIPLVEDTYGVHISEAQAQEALHLRTILKGGEEIDISGLLEQLRPRFAHLLTTVTISKRMLATFIIFSGGGAALLHNEIAAKMQALPGQHEVGKDYLILPSAIAPIANCIGLFAHGYYRVQQLIRTKVTEFLELYESLQALEEKVRAGAAAGSHPPADQQLALQEGQERLRKHVGQYYPLIVQQVRQERRALAG